MKKVLLTLVIAGMLTGTGGCEDSYPKAVEETPTTITFDEVVNAANSRPDIPYHSTSLQRDEIWKAHRFKQNREYIGKLVEWTGQVIDVKEKYGTYTVEFCHIKSHLSDVTVKFPSSMKNILMKLCDRDTVVYRGKITKVSNGGWWNIQLRDGQIISKK